MTPEERREKEEYASMLLARMNNTDRLDMLRRAGLPITGVIITDNVTIAKGEDMTKQTRSEQIQFKITPDAYEALARMAAKSGASVNLFVRDYLLSTLNLPDDNVGQGKRTDLREDCKKS